MPLGGGPQALADSARERPEDMRFVLDAMLATNRHRLEAGATGGTGVQPVGVDGPTDGSPLTAPARRGAGAPATSVHRRGPAPSTG